MKYKDLSVLHQFFGYKAEKQRGGREGEDKRAWSKNCNIRISQVCTNPSVTIKQGKGSWSSDVIFSFNPRVKPLFRQVQVQDEGRWSCNPIPIRCARAPSQCSSWWKKLGSDLVTFPSYIPLSDPQIRFTLSSKIQIVRSGMPCKTKGGHGNICLPATKKKKKKSKKNP